MKHFTLDQSVVISEIQQPIPHQLSYGSVCSGIEAATVAWHGLGWSSAWFAEIEPFPSAVLAYHYPTVPNLGDMTRIRDRIKTGEVLAPDVLVGGTPCFTAGHMVLTSKGYKPIENICVGDLVVTHTGQLKPVVRIGSKLAEVGLLSANGLPSGIVCTADHPFRSVAWRMQNTKREGKYCRIEHLGEPEWTPASQMIGKQWCALTKFDLASPVIQSSKFDDKTAMYVAGMYLGDGHIRKWLGRTKKALILNLNPAKYESFLLAVGGIAHTVTKERTSVRVHIYDTIFCDWLVAHFGEYSHAKVLPAWVLGHQYQSELMQGYIDTDGGIDGNCITINSTSKSLAYGIADLFNANGFSASVTVIKTANKTVIEGRTVNQRDYWQMRAFPQELSRKSRIRHNYLLRAVNSYKVMGNDTVFNIEVAEDNSYILNGAIVHNCQAFSVAGARNSLDDDRGQLTLEYVRLADEIDTARSIRGEQPSIIVWENVPGVLSTKDNAFGCFLGALSGEDCELQPTGKKWTNAGCVFGPKRAVAWRVLDAQYFGLAQRRKRVFVVASARKDFHPDKVLFEFDGLRRDTPPSRSERQETARSTTEGFTTSSIAKCLTARTAMRYDFETEDFVIHGTQDPLVQRDTAFPIGRNSGQENAVYSLQGNLVDRETKQNGSGVSLECAHTLNTQDKHAVAFAIQGNMIGRNDNAGPQGSGVSEDVSFTLTKGDRHGVAHCYNPDQPQVWRVYSDIGISPAMQSGESRGNAIFNHGLVRRLTPKECERLQGFPDEYTKIPYRNKAAEECPDGARYAALGNSMAVAVMEWIGQRIQAYLNGKNC